MERAATAADGTQVRLCLIGSASSVRVADCERKRGGGFFKFAANLQQICMGPLRALCRSAGRL